MTPNSTTEAVAEPRIEPDDDWYEVVNGQRVELPPMGAFPVEINTILGLYLGQFVRQEKLGKVVLEMLFGIDPESKLQRRPDIAFISAGRWPIRRPAPRTAAWEVVPDLVVEVVSPTDRAEDLLGKVREFFEAGTRVAWVVYPVLRVAHIFEGFDHVRVFNEAGAIDGGTILPGFELPMTTLFIDEDEAQDSEPPPDI